MNRSVCIRCGYSKAQALAKCGRCAFEPATQTDQAKSLVLSPAFDDGGMTIGRSAGELSDIAAQIEAGTPYAFAGLELDLVARHLRRKPRG